MPAEKEPEPLTMASGGRRYDSFIQHEARCRAFALLDEGSGTELLGPFDHIESPWLEPQGVVPASDDGVVIVRGTVAGRPTVVIAIEQAFQGGGIGEVSGAKITAALAMALKDSREGRATAAVLLLETGGVRLQEANLGLAAVSEACAGILDLRALAPVVAVIAGRLGCFGGMSIAAGLCSAVIMTREGRLGLNGPEVIESEAGIQELDSADHALVWSIDGGVQRHALGQAGVLVKDDTGKVRAAVAGAVTAASLPRPASRDLVALRARLCAVDPAFPPEPGQLGALFASASRSGLPPREPRVFALETAGRGGRWLAALADAPAICLESTLIEAPLAEGDIPGVLLAVVPDPSSRYHRARNGEVGLLEGLALAERVSQVCAEDHHLPSDRKRPIVSVVDLPSQAYGRLEEMMGIHVYLAAAVDAYATARAAGHPVVALVVGSALSGGFLAHGLQASQILALNDPAVEIHAMHKQAAARITRRTIAELDRLASEIPPLSYAVTDWATLGLCNGLLTVTDADRPSPQDVSFVRDQVLRAVDRARSDGICLERRWSAEAAGQRRAATRRVWEAASRQWK